MPKNLLIDPREKRQRGTLAIPAIPVNQFVLNPAAEIKKRGQPTLVRVLHDMMMVREFETMLNLIKVQGNYHGIEYDHKGPAHLSIGQEAMVVGQALALNVHDFIFGSHRSHGEILAKCLAAITELDEARLMEVMKTYLGGAQLKVVEGLRTNPGSAKDLAIDFVLYGTLAEIFGRGTGFNRGMGGSMHAFFAPFGSMPNNALVGGSADIATGAALFKRVNQQPGIVIANIGDASSACGPVWEAICFAAMDQYHTLWPKEVGGAPPILFNFVNNFYGMGGQPDGETMGFGALARIGAGVNPAAMHAERVDGYDPLAVADAIERKKAVLLRGEGPVLLDVMTYRYSGHSPSDASSYRTKEEVALWEAQDSIKAYSQFLIEHKLSAQSDIDATRASLVERLQKVLRVAISDKLSPRVETMTVDAIGAMMFSNAKVDSLAPGKTPTVLIPTIAENPRSVGNAKKSRAGIDEHGKPLPKAKVIAFRDALFEAMIHRYYADPTMVAFGEENRDWGGAFAVYRGLTEALPYHRLFNSPISEAAIAGAATGYALCGGRVVAELMYCDFLGRAGDEVFNQMSKWQSMSANVLRMPLVLRVSVGSKYGAQHSQDWSSITAHIPGLKVYFPATACDAKGMLNLALRGTDPVIFFESQRLYDIGELFEKDGVPAGYYETPEGQPAVRRQGKDLTIVTVGATLYRAIEAAELLEKKYGVSVEVIDTRFINPLNYDLIIASVKKTGRCLLASDACERGSFLHTMASVITEAAFDALDAPVLVLGARNWITPCAEMEATFFPQPEWFVDVIHERILPLKGHTPTTVQTLGESLRRHRAGV